jgi:hypothetical protein
VNLLSIYFSPFISVSQHFNTPLSPVSLMKGTAAQDDADIPLDVAGGQPWSGARLEERTMRANGLAGTTAYLSPPQYITALNFYVITVWQE